MDSNTVKIEATFTVRGQTFTSKKEAKAYGVIASQIEAFAEANGLGETFVDGALLAHKAGAFTVPKAERKPKAEKAE